MKNTYKSLTLGGVLKAFALLLFVQFSNATVADVRDWTINVEHKKAFIENKGQFKMVHSDEKVLFAAQMGMTNIYFTKTGVHYTFLKTWKKEKDEKELERERKKNFKSADEWMEEERKENRWLHETDVVQFHWENSNPNTEVIGLLPTSDYHSYAFKNNRGELQNINYINGYQKIIYKNLYNGIDVEYTFHPQEGLKYNIIVHPFADASLFKMKFDKNISLLSNGDVRFNTKFGPVTDHAPKTFYQGNPGNEIASSFQKSNNTISLQLNNYDKSKTIVVDPWVSSPTFGTTNWHCVWECERDASGNAYIIGGGASQSAGSQMQVKKYNAAGALQWTYNTPYDTSNCWLGTIATDNAGNSYVTAGSVAQIQKISTAGAVLWNNASPGGLFSTAEFWDITFNCDQTKLVVGGTGGGMMSLQAYIYNIDVNNGNVTSQAAIATGSMFGFPPTIQEVRAITPCPNGRYYFLTHDTLGYINQNFTLCPSNQTSLYKINSGLGLGYKCENYRFDNSGICALKADANFLYVNRGNQIQKRSLATGAVIATATIPGGAFTNVAFSGNTVENSGIDIDNCGNVYVGSKNQVVKFSSNLVQLATYATTFNVYDIAVSSTGEVFACGSTGTSGTANRTGTIQSIAASACAIIPITCCDATICKPQPFCSNDPAVNLVAATPGGTWSGTGITNASAGTFNPAVAGPGTYWIKYTLACGKDSVQITVNSCQAIPVCINANGTLTATGAGPFTWYHQTTTQNCSACIFGCNFPAGCAVNVTTWTSFATGATINPGTYPVYVVTPLGDSAYVANAAAVPSCTGCSLTPSVVSTNSVTCFGANNGSATVGLSGGTGTTTYTWTPSGGNAATATNLAPGTYTVNMTNGSCTASQTLTITQPTSAVTATVTPTNTSCGQNNGSITAVGAGGTGALTYSWTPSASGATITNLASGTYTLQVKDANNCTYTTTAVVANSAAPSATVSYAGSPFCNSITTAQNITQTGSAGGTYSSAPAGLTLNAASGAITPSSSTAGTYTVVYTIAAAGACPTYTTSTTVTINAAPVITPPATQTITCTTPSVSLNATSAGNTLVWNGGALSNAANPASVSAAGTYTVTATSAASCVSTQTVSVTTNTTIPNASATSSGTLTCTTNTVNVTGASSTPGVTYQWTSGPATAVYNVASPGTYTVTVTNPNNGCVNTATVNVVQSGAFPNIAIAAPGTITCATSNVTLNGSSTTPGVTFQWTGGPATANYNVSAAGTYTFSVTDPANSCTSVQTVVVSSNTVAPTISSVTGGTITCTTSNINLNATSTGTLTWNGGSLSNSPNPANVNAAGAYTVTSTDASNGCTSNATITVTSNTVIPNVSIAAPATITCLVTNVNLTASSTTSGVTYQWTAGPATASYNVNAAGTYTVTVTDPSNGCTNNTNVSITSNTTVPVVTANNNGPISCILANVTLTATSAGNTIVWNGGTLSNASNPSNVSAAGTYTATAVDPTNGCASTVTTVVTSNVQIPNVSIAVPAQITCTNPVVVLSGSSTTAGVTYQWSSGSTAATENASTAGTYTLTVTDPSNGCTNSTTVSVTQAPQFTLTLNSNAVSCNGGTNGSATASTQGNGPFTYLWNDPLAQNTATAGSLSAGTYSVTVTETSSGCVQTMGINVTQPNAMNIGITPSATQVCQGDNVVLSANASSGTSPYTYSWSTGQNGQSVNTTVNANTTYTLTVTDANLCLATTTISVNAIPAPVVTFGGTNLNGCTPICSSFSTTVTGLSYTWNFGDGSTSNMNSPVHCYTNAGIYNVSLSVMDNNGCTGTVTMNNYVNANPVANASFFANPNPATLLEPVVNFNNTSENAASYTWYFGTGDSSNLQNPTYFYQNAGEYPVTLIATNSFGCADTTVLTIIVQEDFAVYIPNAFTPDGDNINDLWGPQGVGVSLDNYELLIFDRWGERIFQSTEWGKWWNGTYKGQPVQMDVYVYKIKLKEEKSNLKHEYKGTVSVIR